MDAAKDWPEILGFANGDTCTEEAVDKHYRIAAKKAHPDAGGSNEAMTQLNLAKQLALAWVAKERKRIAEQVIPHPFGQREQQAAMTQHQAANSAYQQQANNAFGSWGMGGVGNMAAGTANSLHQQPTTEAKREWLGRFFRGSR